MRIEELSVGDWVVAKLAKWDYDSPEETEPMRIVCIDNSEPNQAFADLIGGGMVKHSALIDDLHPIPLTPEILEKNGFDKFSECGWRNLATKCFLFRYGTKYWDITINGGNRTYRPTRIRIENILHTHQLQHTLRLAGVEKEIEV